MQEVNGSRRDWGRRDGGVCEHGETVRRDSSTGAERTVFQPIPNSERTYKDMDSSKYKIAKHGETMCVFVHVQALQALRMCSAPSIEPHPLGFRALKHECFYARISFDWVSCIYLNLPVMSPVFEQFHGYRMLSFGAPSSSFHALCRSRFTSVGATAFAVARPEATKRPSVRTAEGGALAHPLFKTWPQMGFRRVASFLSVFPCTKRCWL